MSRVDRRSFIRRSFKYAGGSLIAPSLAGLVACNDIGMAATLSTAGVLRRARAGEGGYGALRPYRTSLRYRFLKAFTRFESTRRES